MSKREYQVRFEPDGLKVRVAQGTALPRAAAAAGCPVELPCGGLGLCGKCKVEIQRGAPAPDGDEQRLLTANELREGLRLACRQQVHDDLVVTLGEAVRSRGSQIMVGGLVRATDADSGVELLHITLPPPEIHDQRDHWRKVETLLDRSLAPSLGVLQQMPAALPQGAGEATVTVVDGCATRIRPGLAAGPPLGVAIDIGTTTVVCYLLDLSTGAELAHAALLNPQVAYGDDVISRIHFAYTEPDGLRTLSREVRRGIDHLIKEVCHEVGADPADLARGTVVGNTTMAQIFLGISPKDLGAAPFAPVVHEQVTASGQELGLRTAPAARFTVLPNIGGFLGSDTVGVMLAVMADPSVTTLAVDIGTNGEMVLYHQGKWYGCSAAAGPAFEGARIGCGMRGAHGAISRLAWDDGLSMSIIGGGAPRGLCGSGLLDAVALLLDTGVLDVTGRLQDPDTLPPELGARVVGDGPQRAFVLATAEESATGEPLLLTAQDLREVQLAKGSIRASIEALLAREGLAADQIDALYLAGGFGSYLRVESAVRMGLLPPVPRDRITAVGNAAGAGARLALMSRAELARATRLARRVQNVYLAHEPVYQMQFMEQMLFPEGALTLA